MNTYSGTKLDEKINAFRLKKGLQAPSRFDASFTVDYDYRPSLLSRMIMALEKMDRLWAQDSRL